MIKNTDEFISFRRQVDLALVLAHLDCLGVCCHLQLQSRILQTCQTGPGPCLHPRSVRPISTRSELQSSTLLDLLDLLNPAGPPKTD